MVEITATLCRPSFNRDKGVNLAKNLSRCRSQFELTHVLHHLNYLLVFLFLFYSQALVIKEWSPECSRTTTEVLHSLSCVKTSQPLYELKL